MKTKRAGARPCDVRRSHRGRNHRSLLTAAAAVLRSPELLSSRIVRQGLLSDPKILPDAVDALRDAQYAPVLADNRAAIETPFASSWKGAAKPTSPWSNSSIMPAPIARPATRHRSAAQRGQGPARGLSRAADPRPRQRDCGAALARGIEARPLLAIPRHFVEDRPARARPRSLPPRRRQASRHSRNPTRRSRPSSSATSSLRASSARPEPRCS